MTEPLDGGYIRIMLYKHNWYINVRIPKMLESCSNKPDVLHNENNYHPYPIKAFYKSLDPITSRMTYDYTTMFKMKHKII